METNNLRALMVLFVSVVPCIRSYPLSLVHSRSAIAWQLGCTEGISRNQPRKKLIRSIQSLHATATTQIPSIIGDSEPLTADKIEKRLKSLKDNDRYDFDSVVKEFDALRSANQIKLWSSVVPSFRRTSLGEVKMLTRGVIKEGTLDINGEDDMQTINFSFYGTLVSSMALSLLAACVIPDVDIPFMCVACDSDEF
jgi:hypothetical protein